MAEIRIHRFWGSNNIWLQGTFGTQNTHRNESSSSIAPLPQTALITSPDSGNSFVAADFVPSDCPLKDSEKMFYEASAHAKEQGPERWKKKLLGNLRTGIIKFPGMFPTV